MTWFACLLVKKVVCKKHWPDDVIEPYTHTHTHTQVQLCSCWLPKTMSSPWRPGRQDELFGAELCGQHGRRPAALDHNKCLVLFQPSSCKLTPRLQAETPSWHAHHFLFNLLHPVPSHPTTADRSYTAVSLSAQIDPFSFTSLQLLTPVTPVTPEQLETADKN